MCNTTFIMKPKVDFCFKELMASEAVRRGFIAAVLQVGQEEIRQTKLLPTSLNQPHADDKLGILDVRVVLDGGIQMDMEIQISPFKLWPERSLFYLSKMYVEQIHKGEKYGALKKCIHIGILDFALFEDEEFYSRFHIWEDSRRRMYSDKFEVHIVELPKLKEHEYPETALLNWARFICAEKKEEFEMIASKDPCIKQAYEQLLFISADETKRREYEARQKAILDYNQLMSDNYEQGYKKGEEEGRVEGKEEGRVEGEERLNELYRRLVQANRMEDLKKAMNDKEYRDKLYKEFQL